VKLEILLWRKYINCSCLYGSKSDEICGGTSWCIWLAHFRRRGRTVRLW
jgi:hypothetical protein